MNKVLINKIPKKILVIKPSSLGDIVHSLPFLNAVKDAFPFAEIHWIVAKGLEGLLENHPMVKRLWIINKDQWKNKGRIKETVAEFISLFKELERESYDIVIDLQGLMRSGILTYMTRSRVRIGFKEARECSSMFYTHRIKGGKEIHAVDRYLKIASALGCEIGDVKFPMPLIKESEDVKRLKRDIGDYAVLVPGARWMTKRWKPVNFGSLASMLDIKTVVVGSSMDAEIAKGIEFCSNGKAKALAGKTDIKELISIVRGARYVVSNDSGPMHIAAAFGIPIVAIFGPTNPVRTGPYGKNNIVVKSGVECAPCYKKNCRKVKCMDDISVEDVYEAVMSIC
ncbi:glycosyltransferase family 9 protein [hot springs metagenome]|uniref:lipopolysaccharide heptosyltransferase II n=1 Tax=hot springs metagenome TaxID=433727 RepID=A0A5J4L4W3_9ZZZZ